ncbi:uncharacterized protein ycf45 isoform X4 [Morus notabilis]|uniref:uncharacterized protein ycf45 isoform X4 n=1 Tax=Morus notabilis TaxID=981085 RepID=UPI000CED70BB|nr:uncharacterized protein ycf45 isoform X4 [Morus notabilis]
MQCMRFPLLQIPPLKQASASKFPSTKSFPYALQCPKYKYSSISLSLTKTFSGYRNSSLSCSCSSSEDDFEDELGRLLALLPEEIRQRIWEHPELHQLIEVVMDFGRKPLARFPSGDSVLSDSPITLQDLQYATSQVGDFAIDDRAGISRTLHRISAIRNRKGAIIGLTCRVGRAITGSANLLRYLVQDGASLLLIGPPGVGKTTIIREIARMLANDYNKRVMIVDTSNEIGGDGDIPHAGIGNARRMQVPDSNRQHEVLIEAVENHMPQVIVIDEIGTKLEAMAASTIAQRGIQLVATAHGVTIKNLIMNPSLEMLVGGIQVQRNLQDVITNLSVTLGDEEASRRGVQKSVLERKGPATFSCAVEIVSKTELRVHRSLETTVDAILAGRFPNVEVRKIKSNELEDTLEREPFICNSFDTEDELMDEEAPELIENGTYYKEFTSEVSPNMGEASGEGTIPLRLFVYGEARLAIEQVVIPKGEPAELLPRPTRIMTLQLDLIRRYQLEAERIGSGAETRLCILPLHVRKNEEDDTKQNDMSVSDSELDDFVNSKGNTNVSPYCVDRLPLLPE